MKILQKQHPTLIIILMFIFFNACRPCRNLQDPLLSWQGGTSFASLLPEYDAAKKNVFIISDCKGTELFDMLAPFNLFNATGKANVYIVAKDKTPVLIKRGLFVVPQLTFGEADSMKLKADLVVIPALSIRDKNQDTVVINWIRNRYLPDTRILAICDGAATAAATGLYDGKQLTCHASDFENLKSRFEKPLWVKNIAVTKSGNLFSTAGVSNAVEGSLTLINEMFGKETMHSVLTGIDYPGSEIKTAHESIVINGRSKFTVAKKIIFKHNRNIGLLIEKGINELDMAAILDTYSRTFPASFRICHLNGHAYETKYGLTMVCTNDNDVKDLDELHVIQSLPSTGKDTALLRNIPVVEYTRPGQGYIIDNCLARISRQYGNKFGNVIRQSLDYN